MCPGLLFKENPTASSCMNAGEKQHLEDTHSRGCTGGLPSTLQEFRETQTQIGLLGDTAQNIHSKCGQFVIKSYGNNESAIEDLAMTWR